MLTPHKVDRCYVDGVRTRRGGVVVKPSPVPNLTPRMLDILALIAEGHGNIAIGKHLGIAEDTVKTMIRHLLSRLQATDRAHATAIAMRYGALTENPQPRPDQMTVYWDDGIYTGPEVRVTHYGNGRWSVRYRAEVLNGLDTWDQAPNRLHRPVHWLADHTFGRTDATDRAKRWAAHLYDTDGVL